MGHLGGYWWLPLPYDVKLQSDSKGQVRGYAIKRGNSIYKSSELGKGRYLMSPKIEKCYSLRELFEIIFT